MKPGIMRREFLPHQVGINNQLTTSINLMNDQLPPEEIIDPLCWDDTYAIALALEREYPRQPLEEVSLGMIYRWTLGLPEFEDDKELANEAILESIYQEWMEAKIS